MKNPQKGTFKVTLSAKKTPEGGPVYCKTEKNFRFNQLKTVKLCAETTYRLDISFMPPRHLECLIIDGKETETKEKARDSTASAYSAYYSTHGSMPNKKGTRHVMIITMKVRNSGEVSTRIQVKFYGQRNLSHCEWGSKLHCIELDCSMYDANIIKETYRKIGKEDVRN